MTQTSPLETSLQRLLTRLLQVAEASLAAGDIESARATAEEVLAVDAHNEQAQGLLARAAAPERDVLGERALMTLAFADIVGSTALSEILQPEELRDLFGEYRGIVRAAVETYGGNVLKYMGDGVLCGFGYPHPHEDDARRAVLASLETVEAMRRAEPRLRDRFGESLMVRVGVHTGLVVVADLSGAGSLDERESILGATPNLAARIQNIAEPDRVVVSDVTHHLVDADFHTRSLGERDLKGISRSVEVFEVRRSRHAGARFYADRYQQGHLIGREREMAQISAAWERTRSEHGTPGPAVLVSGDAGMGKTRLVAEAAVLVQRSGGRVLGAGCLPYHSSVSLWPVARLIERAFGMTPGVPDRGACLTAGIQSAGLDPATAAPFLAPLVGAAEQVPYPAPRLDPAALLEETQNQVVAWLTALASARPLLLVVEDMHWADASTIALLTKIASHGVPGLLLVCTSREAGSWGVAESVTELALAPLPTTAAAELVEATQRAEDPQSRGGDPSEEASADRDRMVELAGGIPLFIEELARSHARASERERVPLRLHELLAWRLKSPDVDQRTAQVAATVGPTFEEGTVAAAMQDTTRVHDALESLSRVGILDPDPAAPGVYRFRHALMRDAAYETQVLDVRRSTHARLAEVLAQRGAEPAVLAQHYDSADKPADACRYYVAAAQLEQSRGAHTEATRLLSRAIDLVATRPASTERDVDELTMRMLRAYSVSSIQGYAAPEAQQDHRRLDALTQQLPGRIEIIPALIAGWAFWFTSGELGTSASLLERLESLVATEAFSWFRPEVMTCVGWQKLYVGELDTALQQLKQAMDGYEARPAEQDDSPLWPLPNDSITVCAVAIACVCALRGRPSDVASWIARAEERAAGVPFPRGPFSLAFAKTYDAWIQRFLGDRARSQSVGAEVVGIGMEFGYTYWMLLGSSYIAAGAPGEDPDPAVLEETVATLHGIGHLAFTASAMAFLAELHAEHGELDKAFEAASEALTLVNKTGELVHLPEVLRVQADLLVARGRAADAAEAAATYREAYEHAREQGATLSRLRAALGLAVLPGQHRPDDWQEMLATARAAVPSDASLLETARADALLTDAQ